MEDTRSPLERGLRRVRKRLGLPVGPSPRSRDDAPPMPSTKQDASAFQSMPPTPLASTQEHFNDISEGGSSLSPHAEQSPPKLPTEEQVRAIGMETDPSSATRGGDVPQKDNIQGVQMPTIQPVTPEKTNVATVNAVPRTPDPRQPARDAAPTSQSSARTNSVPEAVPEEAEPSVESPQYYVSAGLSSPTAAEEEDNTTVNTAVPTEPRPVYEPVADLATESPPLTPPRARSPLLASSTTSCAGSAVDAPSSEAAQLLQQLQGVLRECRALLDNKRARADRYAAKLHRGGSVEKLQRRRNKMEQLMAQVHVVESELEELDGFAQHAAQVIT